MENRSTKLLTSLNTYYSSDCALQKLLSVTSETESGVSSKISLRLIDWLVTNFSKCEHVVYDVDNKMFNMHISYKNMLKAYSKRMFDPFKRHDRIYIECPRLPSGKLETTVAQMMFFKWAIDHNVLAYAIEHKEAIKRHMEASTEQRKVKHIVKRSELSKGSRSAHIYNVKLTVSFK
jgi:hypothetical protein|tara:strand:- start:5958 stop:6488 length:531 start_codon:yes stop_codon:yes gene_type:complete